MHNTQTSYISQKTRIKIFLWDVTGLCVMHILCFEYIYINTYTSFHLCYHLLKVAFFLFLSFLSVFSKLPHPWNGTNEPGRGWNIKAHQRPSLHLPAKRDKIWSRGHDLIITKAFVIRPYPPGNGYISHRKGKGKSSSKCHFWEIC